MPRPKKKTPAPSLREQQLRKDIQALEEISRAAAESRSFTPAGNARAKVAALRQQLHRLRDIRLAKGSEDPLVALQHRMTLAEADGSWQAVAQLTKLHNELLVNLAKASAEQAAAEMLELSDDELLDMIVLAVEDMAPEHVQVVLDAANERLGGQVIQLVDKR